MLKSKLERFIFKRTVIFFVILSILDILLLNSRWIVLSGLTAGAVIGTLRLNFLGNIYTRLLLPSENQVTAKWSVLSYVIGQAVIFVLMILSAIAFGKLIFMSFTAGVLIIPAAVFINSLTEALGITHNNFE